MPKGCSVQFFIDLYITVGLSVAVYGRATTYDHVGYKITVVMCSLFCQCIETTKL